MDTFSSLLKPRTSKASWGNSGGESQRSMKYKDSPNCEKDQLQWTEKTLCQILNGFWRTLRRIRNRASRKAFIKTLSFQSRENYSIFVHTLREKVWPGLRLFRILLGLFKRILCLSFGDKHGPVLVLLQQQDPHIWRKQNNHPSWSRSDRWRRRGLW